MNQKPRQPAPDMPVELLRAEMSTAATSASDVSRTRGMIDMAARLGTNVSPIPLRMSETAADAVSQHRSDMLVDEISAMSLSETGTAVDLEKFLLLMSRALKARRIILGESLEDAAKRMTVTRQYLSTLERGGGTLPALLNYSLVLGVRPSSVLRAIGL